MRSLGTNAAMQRKQASIAVVGVSALFAGSSDAHGFWRDILAGRDLITDVPESHWLIEDYYDADPKAPDKTYARRGAFIGPTNFDPVSFGIPPSIVPATDTSQLLALIVAQKVLEDASRSQFAEVDRERMSVILGVTSAQELMLSMASRLQRPVWVRALRECGLPEDEVQRACDKIAANYVPWQEATFPGLLGNVVAGRIANRFDLRGTNAVTDAACASSLAALSMAIAELTTGQSDVVITGGVDTMNDISMYVCFSKTPALSPTGDCRPFSDAADGTILGEGLAMVALKRLEDAERDGDRIYAVIRGIGSSSDGRGASVYAPVPAGQARALRRAYEIAGYSPETVELVEAHGTGTKAGDAAEFEALRMVFSEANAERKQWCALGSVKSQIGHCKAAAGAAGLFKAVMALHHKVLPPTIKVERPNPKLEIDRSPFYLNTQTRPWIRASAHPRRASVSSFGFGGSNFHVTLEEWKGSERSKAKPAWRIRSAPSELVVLSAHTPAELIAQAKALSSKCAGATLMDLARASQTTFDGTRDVRASIVATDTQDLATKIEHLVAHASNNPTASLDAPSGIAYACGERAGEVAFLFPGQGSQYVGMGAELAIERDEARAVWDASADVLYDGVAVHQVVFPKPVFSDADRDAQQQLLTATEWAQPAIGLASAAMLATLSRLGVKPAACAGHSYGEITALYCAGAFDWMGFVKASRRRGELMRDAAKTPGAMTAVVHDVAAVHALLKEWAITDVVVANHNAPTQVVLSGTIAEIERVEKKLAERGITAKRLPVATAFHSSVVSSSSGPFAEFLQSIPMRPAQIPVFGNADAEPYPSDPNAMRERLAAQLAQPVRFVSVIEAMYARGIRTFVEVGPGSVLTDLVGRILSGRSHRAISTDRRGKHGLTSLHEALGKLAVAGVKVDFAPLWHAYEDRTHLAPKPKPKFELQINGSNYGKPYPPPGGARALPKPNPSASAKAVAPGRAVASASASDPAVATTPVAAVNKPVNGSSTKLTSTLEVPASLKPEAQRKPGNTSLTSTSASSNTMVSPMRDDIQLAWVRAYQEAQRQTIEAHASFQRAMAETQVAFLEMAKSSFNSLAAIMTGQPMVAIEQSAAAPMALAASTPNKHSVASEAASVVVAAPIAPAPVSVAEPVSVAATAPAAVAQPAPVAAPEAAPTAPSRTSGVDLEKVLLEIVAEKTGYPTEMLGMQMELEADLGIDSIKRVEILSAMRARVPHLPEVKPNELAQLRTLGQIVENLRSRSGDATTAVPTSATTRLFAGDREKIPKVARFVVRLHACAPIGLAIRGLFGGGRVVITRDGAGIAEALVCELARRHVRSEVCESSEVPSDASVLVCLDGLREVASIDEAIGVNRMVFSAVKSVARTFMDQGGTLVTVQDTGGDFGLSGREPIRAWLGGVAALARTCAQEWPLAQVQAIDLARAGRDAHTLAKVIADELVFGGGQREVALGADNTHYTVQIEEVSLPASGTASLQADAVVVATGGARGVTASCLIELARSQPLKIALLGRTPLEEEPAWAQGQKDEGALKRAFLLEAHERGAKVTPAQSARAASQVLANREIRATMDAIRAAGSDVRYIATDVQDAERLRAALDEVRAEWGAIHAIVHGAGVLADKLIVDKTQAQFDRVFDTKVAALRTLLEATANDPLQAICLFSSVAARTGNLGQSDYAMANEVLNLVASAERARRGDACTVRSLGWGPWAGGMVTPELAQHFEKMSVPLIPIEAGARAFVRELNREGSDVHVVLGARPGLGALGSDSDRPAITEVLPHATTHRYLADHMIAGTVVVPVVVALEWMQRAARALCPEHVVRAIRAVKVMSGIKLDHFDRHGDRLVLSAKKLSNGRGIVAQVELRGRNDRLHYSAQIELGEPRTPIAFKAPVLSDLEPWDAVVYDGFTLFHGECFRVLSEVEVSTTSGAVAALTGLAERGWTAEPWQWDPAAMDGALQLAVLWAKRALGGPTLPMAIGAVDVFAHGAVNGPVRCVVQAKSAKDHRAVSDVFVVDQEGSVLVQLSNVEMILRPDSAQLTASA